MSPSPSSPSGAAAMPSAGASAASPSLSLWEVLSVVTAYRTHVERVKLYRVTVSLLRFLSILNVVYTLLGVTFLVVSLLEDVAPAIGHAQREQFFRIGLLVSIISPLASLVDLLALRGLRVWKRGFLLPWLFYYAFLIALVFAETVNSIFHNGFRWTYLVLLLCVFCCFCAWRNVRAQYTEMARERPACRTIEELAADLRAHMGTASSSAAAPCDLPPKYEDLEQPPNYFASSVDVPEESAEAAPKAKRADSDLV